MTVAPTRLLPKVRAAEGGSPGAQTDSGGLASAEPDRQGTDDGSAEAKAPQNRQNPTEAPKPQTVRIHAS